MAWIGMLGSPGRLTKDLASDDVLEARYYFSRADEDWSNLPKNASRDITTTANSDHEIGVELLEDGISRLLAQLVHLLILLISFLWLFRVCDTPPSVEQAIASQFDVIVGRYPGIPGCRKRRTSES